MPAAGWSPTRSLLVEDAPEHDAARRTSPGYREVSAGYFEAMGIPIARGRSFSSIDREDTQPVAIVSAALAARFWPGRDPLGRRLQIGDSKDRWLTIVGVAGDVTMYNWRTVSTIQPSTFRCGNRLPPAASTWPSGHAARHRSWPVPVRAALASLDPQLAVDNMRTMEQAIEGSTFGLNFLTSLLGVCGAIALMLAVVGIYSMMAYTVSQRRYEFGVRMALGASTRDILGCSLRQAGFLTVSGLAIGVVLASTAAQFMSAALLGVIQLDMKTLVGVTGALAIVSLAAAILPRCAPRRSIPRRCCEVSEPRGLCVAGRALTVTAQRQLNDVTSSSARLSLPCSSLRSTSRVICR